jgi:parvulin-like peptidyl-prolyl isomerase
MSRRQIWVILIAICFLPIFYSACRNNRPITTSTPTLVMPSETKTSSLEPSQTPIPPTATSIPLVAIVNGESITLADFQAEISRYQASLTITGTVLASDTNTIVLNELIDQTLLAHAASENGFIVDEPMLQSRIDTLEAQLGGTQALTDWQVAHGYSSEDFKRALQRSIGAAWMRDQIIATVPETADEVHVMQILLPTSAEADQAYALLQSGKDFLVVAFSYDPLTGGDLGWVPRGYLSDPAIEAAAFTLQPGQYSSVIQTSIGFHILYSVERDPNHSLQPDARRALQVKALQDWISEQRKQSEIQLFLP